MSKNILFAFLFSCVFVAQNTYANNYMLNGVLFTQAPPIDIPPQVRLELPEGFRLSFLWTLEVEEPVKSYEELAGSMTPARLTGIFINPVTFSAGYTNMWKKRVSNSHGSEVVNEHAESFLRIIGGFPETFGPGEQFSIERLDNGRKTVVRINDEIVDTIDKPGHFNFWARAWYMGEWMPAVNEGSLLSAGEISENMLDALSRRDLPAGYTLFASEPENQAKKLLHNHEFDAQSHNEAKHAHNSH